MNLPIWRSQEFFFYNFIVSASSTSFADEVVAIIEVGAIDLVLDTYVALD